jgi:hypothetical protein
MIGADQNPAIASHSQGRIGTCEFKFRIRDQRMIPKSGNRFSDKVMRK